MLIPRDATKLGIVIEFKKVDTYEDETLEQAAVSAIKQINEKMYAQEMTSREVSSALAIGIAFNGKKILMQSMLLY